MTTTQLAAPRRDTRRQSAVAAAASAAFAVGSIVLFTSAGRDDSYISYGAADRLASTGRILNYSGEQIEQSSSLLHTIVLAVLHRVTTISIPTLGYVLGSLAAAGAIYAAGSLAASFNASRLTAIAFAGVGAPLAYWAVGGLETSFAALALAVTSIAANRYVAEPDGRRGTLAIAAISIALYASTRPEGAVVVFAAFLLALVLITGSRGTPADEASRARQRLVTLAGTAIGIGVALAMARRVYFGEWLPQPAIAKSRFPSPELLGEGFTYLRVSMGIGLTACLVLSVVACVSAFRRGQVAVLIAGSLALAGLLAVLASGGDWMEAGRFVAPVVPLLAALATVPLAGLQPRPRHVIAAVLVLALCFDTIELARNDSTGGPLWDQASWVGGSADEGNQTSSWIETRNRVHRRDLPAIRAMNELVSGLAKTNRGAPITVASASAGMVAYYATADTPVPVRFIDVYGLTSKDFAACPELVSKNAEGSRTDVSDWYNGNRVCGVAPPDIIFNLGTPHPDQLKLYRVWFQSTGTITGQDGLLPGRPVSGEQYVLVRKDLPVLVQS